MEAFAYDVQIINHEYELRLKNEYNKYVTNFFRKDKKKGE